MKYSGEPSVYRSLSRIYRQDGKTDSALHVLGLGRKRFPQDKSLIIDELNLYLDLGRLTEMIPKLQQAIHVDSTNANLHFALGTAYENLANKQEDSARKQHYIDSASIAYNNAIEIRPEYFDAVYNLGAMYYNQATDIIQKMNELGIDQEDKYAQLKKKRNKLYNKALPHLEKAHELEPSDENTIRALKEIYARLNAKEKYKKMEKKLKQMKGE
jgi:tetratricopeptide (TPR) repeat protein